MAEHSGLAFSSDDLARGTVDRRAVEAVIWGTPAVNFDLMHQAMVRDAKAGDCSNKIVYWSRLFDWKNQTLTPNPDSIYFVAFFNTKDVGPVVLEIPPADEGSITGSIDDCWQTAIEDVGPAGMNEGKGGKYFILPPGYKEQPPSGCMALQSYTYQGYPYTQRDNPPKMQILDSATKNWSGRPPAGMEYWRRLDDVIQREPIEPRDVFFHAMLRPLGLEKGKPFKPNARQTKILTDAALVGEAMAKANTADRRFANVKYQPGSHWDFALQLDADDPGAFWNLIDERASWFYEAVGAGLAMAPKRPGPSSAYLGAYKDKSGEWLDGGTSYRLRVPPDPPIKLFWSVTVYDVDTRALILNKQKIAGRSPRMDLRRNEDGSVDIYCGPNARSGFEKNWIPTVPGKNWFAYFRFFQPTESYFDRSWPLPDFEQVSINANLQLLGSKHE